MVHEHATMKGNKFPKTQEEADLAEKMLADELGSLSMLEHERVLFDVHGIAQLHEEDPPNLDEVLGEVDAKLAEIDCKTSFERAQYINEDYVNDRAFRLRFLRGQLFDAESAALCIVKHFAVKEALFGTGDVLGREVLLSDLSDVAIEAIESGFLQLVPSRDSAGRTVYFIASMNWPDISAKAINECFWYIINVSLMDEETQLKGGVFLVFNTGHNATNGSTATIEKVKEIGGGIPNRNLAVHYCFDNAKLRPWVAGVQLALEKPGRARFRSHFGDQIQFELQTYGIPTELVPIEANGVLSVTWHTKWLQARRSYENKKDTPVGVVVPRRLDILFGRGKFTREHVGNLRAYNLVEQHQSRYEAAGKFQKTAIADSIVKTIQQSFGRFLKWDAGGWVEVSEEAARDKISHFFRFLRTRQKSAVSGGNTSLPKRAVPGASLPPHNAAVRAMKKNGEEQTL